MNFIEALHKAAENREFIEQYDRLKGTNLSLKGSIIEKMVDIESGRLDQELKDFIEFFDQHIWQAALNSNA